MKTTEMLALLQRTRDFDRFINRCSDSFSECSVSEVLAQLEEKYGVPRSKVIARSGIEKGYVYQVYSGRRVPSRDKLVCLAFGLGAELEDAQRLLRAAEKRELYPRVRRDAAIIYCLLKRLPLEDCHTLLQSAGEEELNG